MTARVLSTRLLGLLLFLAVLTACGVPGQDRPTVIDPTNVPNGLLAKAEPERNATPTVTPQPNPDTYFVGATRLFGVNRTLPDGSDRARLRAALFALFAGPTEAEQAAGLGTAIPNGLGFTVDSVLDGEATIELIGELRNNSPENNVLAVGQIVLTAAAQPGVERVRLTQDGETLKASLVDGSLKLTPLTAADYESLVASR